MPYPTARAFFAFGNYLPRPGIFRQVFTVSFVGKNYRLVHKSGVEFRQCEDRFVIICGFDQQERGQLFAAQLFTEFESAQLKHVSQKHAFEDSIFAVIRNL